MAISLADKTIRETADLPDAARGAPKIEYDAATEVVTIDGFRFARALFAQFTASPLGVRFRILSRDDGTITVGQERDPLEAAAPDMLALLSEIVPAIRNIDMNGRIDSLVGMYRDEHGQPVNFSMPDWLAKADAALALSEQVKP